MTAPTGYTRTQIVLHLIVVLPILQQYVSKDEMSAAWEAFGDGLETAVNPLVLAHVAGGLRAERKAHRPDSARGGVRGEGDVPFPNNNEAGSAL